MPKKKNKIIILKGPSGFGKSFTARKLNSKLKTTKGNIGIELHDLGKGLNPKFLKFINPKLKKKVEKWITNFS
jgi:ABC-type oligopeptide transport system ATPase subunit